MARRWRIYENKRGNRRTGSTRWAGYGEALFFAFFIVAGVIGVVMLTAQVIVPEWQANRGFVEHECKIVAKRVGKLKRPDSAFFRPEFLVRYEAHDQVYEAWTYDINQRASNAYQFSKQEAQEICDAVEVGARYRCWYDPSDTDRVVLVRGYSVWLWWTLVLPVVLIVMGAVGSVRALLQSETSAERRAALAKKASEFDLLNEASNKEQRLPNVPQDHQITDSPGTQLTYRLPLDSSNTWNVGGVLLACLLWNGIVAWFVVETIMSLVRGQGGWLMTLMLLPFIAAGGWLVRYAIRQVMIFTGIGTTRLEISDHPLLPDHDYEVAITQTCRFKLKRLTILLVCDEEATYQQGTDTRTEVRRVSETVVYDRRRISADKGEPFQDTCTIHIPAGAMHSFRASYNRIRWKLVVQGDIAHWPDYQRQYRVIVHPLTQQHATV